MVVVWPGTTSNAGAGKATTNPNPRKRKPEVRAELEKLGESPKAATESGVLKRTVQYQLLRGLLKGRQIPGSGIWLIDRADFEAWLAERDQQTEKGKQ